MKKFFKCIILTLAVSAVVVLALLGSGCNKNSENPSTSGNLIGTWSAEFYEEEFGGRCIVDYSFNEGGTGICSLKSCIFDSDTDSSFPILWRVDGTDKLSLIPESEKEIYDNLEMEWPTVTFRVSSETLKFINDDNDVFTFIKAN